MRKLLRILFSRITLVTIIVLIQLAVFAFFMVYDVYPYINKHVFISVELIQRILAIIFTLRVINLDMTIEGKLTWCILILIFPVVGILCYFLFVRIRPIKRHRKYFKHIQQEILRYQDKYPDEDQMLKNATDKYYGQFEYIYNSTKLKSHIDTSVEYYKQGEQFFEALKANLKQAKKYIFMEYFIIQHGRMWNEILHILAQKAKQGVEVRLMYDDLGSVLKLPANYYKRLQKLGIKCIKFNNFTPIVSAVQNNRDHRKITIIDGEIGFIGGINLADEYINEIQPYGHWKDTGIKLHGGAVKNLVIMFLHLYDVQSMKVEDFSKYFSNKQFVFENDFGIVCPFDDGPRYVYKDNVSENVYLNIINQASNYLWITTPYLIMDNKLTDAICRASMRGVDVRIVTPHVPDKRTIHALTRSSYKKLQEAGVKVYEYTKGFIHAKQVLCDDQIAVNGTINFDYRSLLHHYECGALICRSACLKDIKTDFEHLFTVSMDMKDFKQNAFIRLMCAVIKVFTPML